MFSTLSSNDFLVQCIFDHLVLSNAEPDYEAAASLARCSRRLSGAWRQFKLQRLVPDVMAAHRGLWMQCHRGAFPVPQCVVWRSDQDCLEQARRFNLLAWDQDSLRCHQGQWPPQRHAPLSLHWGAALVNSVSADLTSKTMTGQGNKRRLEGALGSALEPLVYGPLWCNERRDLPLSDVTVHQNTWSTAWPPGLCFLFEALMEANQEAVALDIGTMLLVGTIGVAMGRRTRAVLESSLTLSLSLTSLQQRITSHWAQYGLSQDASQALALQRSLYLLEPSTHANLDLVPSIFVHKLRQCIERFQSSHVDGLTLSSSSYNVLCLPKLSLLVENRCRSVTIRGSTKTTYGRIFLWNPQTDTYRVHWHKEAMQQGPSYMHHMHAACPPHIRQIALIGNIRCKLLALIEWSCQEEQEATFLHQMFQARSRCTVCGRVLHRRHSISCGKGAKCQLENASSNAIVSNQQSVCFLTPSQGG